MTDVPATVPPLVERLLHDFAQKALTTVATGLLAHGVLTPGQGGQLVEVGTALILYAAGCIWTAMAAKIRQQRELNLQAQGPANEPRIAT